MTLDTQTMKTTRYLSESLRRKEEEVQIEATTLYLKMKTLNFLKTFKIMININLNKRKYYYNLQKLELPKINNKNPIPILTTNRTKKIDEYAELEEIP